MKKTITVELVSKGHPDKVADTISDIVCDVLINQFEDRKSFRAGIETMFTAKKIIISGETNANISSTEIINIKDDILKYLDSLGYETTKEIEIIINKQSKEIAKQVDKEVIGAGDQGIVYGTINKIEYYMSAKTFFEQFTTNKKGELIDAKTLLKFDSNGNVSGIVSTGSDKEIKDYDIPKRFKNVVINKFELQGANADVGMTGRKICSDNYGGLSRVGGGAFSGKDLSKVDRSGAILANVISLIYRIKDVRLEYRIGESTPFFPELKVARNIKVEDIMDFPLKDGRKLIDMDFVEMSNGIDEIVSKIDLKKIVESRLI